MKNKISTENKRPVPGTKEGFFLRSKNCNERIYIYLLLKSKRRPDGTETHRYVEKMTNQKIAEDLGLSRNTVGKRLKDLIDFGYVTVDGKYYLVPKTDYYTLIPEETLDFLLNYIENKDKIIKLYIILYEYFNNGTTFSMIDLHKELGYNLSKDGKPISNNSKHIRTLLMILSEAGLIKYKIYEGRNDKGAPIDRYKIIMMRSKIDDMYRDSYLRLKAGEEPTEYWNQVQNFYNSNTIN